MSSMGLMQHSISQSEGSWKTPLMTLFALALYWPLFMLPLFPGEFFSSTPIRLIEFYVFSSLISCNALWVVGAG